MKRVRRVASRFRTVVWFALLVLVAAEAPAFAEESGKVPRAGGESEFLGRIRQLTFEGVRAGEGYFTPDGSKMVFQSEREPGNPFFQIYVLDLETGDTRRISPGRGKTTCAFFRPNTGQIVFASTHHDPESEELQREEYERRAEGREKRYSWDYDPEMDLYVYEPDGGKLRRLTDARGYDAEASYSPDGKWIVFTSMRSGYENGAEERNRKQLEIDPSVFADIYLMRADGSGLRRLTDARGYDGGPFFSPDGKRITWRRFDEEGLRADIWSMNADGSDQRPLTDFGCMSWAPYYHPSGKYLFFTSNKLGFANFELFIVDAEGLKEPVRVTYTDGFDGLPVPTPDGKGIAWTSTRRSQGKGQIFMADWNHEKALKALRRAPAREHPGSPASAGAATVADIVSELERLGFEPLPGMEALEVFDEAGGRHGGHVIAFLPATPGAGPDGEEAILVGAGLDEEVGIEVARKIAATDRKHPVIVAFWSREAPVGKTLAEARLLACIQLHHEGPAMENRLEVRGVASSPVWPGLLERANVPVGFDLQIEDDPEMPVDATDFGLANVPAVELRTVTADPSDMAEGAAESAGSDESERMARFASLLVRRLDGLDRSPEFVSVESRKGKPEPKKQKPYTGTIPDYTAEVEGVLLNGVMEGGPAEAAGLAKGDVIIEFAGKPIAGIYDYRDALETVEVGRSIQVVYLRDGERHEVTVVPTARP